MPTVRDPVLELAERQLGLIALHQAADLGTTRRALRQRLAHDGWVPMGDRVIRRTGAPRTPAQAALAAVLDAGPAAWLSHLSAGSWWGLGGCPLRPVHVVTTRRSRRSNGLAVVHVVRSVPERWTIELGGIPVVRPELLAVHLFAIQRYERAERLVEQLWSRRLLHPAALRQLLHELGRSGRNGVAGLRRYLDDRGPGYVPAASGVEARTMQLLADAGIVMHRQVDTGDGSSWLGRVDFRHATLPVVLEVQSELHHTALVDRRADAARRSALQRAGFRVVECTDTEVWQSPGAVVVRVAEAVRGFRAEAARPERSPAP